MAHWVGCTALLVVLVAPINMALGIHMFLKDSVLEVLIAVSVTLFLFFSRQVRYRIDPLVIALMATMAWGVISIMWSANPDYSVVHLLHWVTAGVVAGAALQLHQPRDRIVVLRYLFASGCFVSVLGAMQHLGGFDAIAQAKPPAATFANRNMAMHIIVLSWWLGPLLMVLDKGSWRHRLWQYIYSVGAALMLIFATYTETRAALVAIGIQSVLLASYFLVTRIRGVSIPEAGNISRRALAVGVVVLILFTNIGPGGFDPVWTKDVNLTQLADPIEDETGYERLVVWGSTLDIIRDHRIFGVGLGAFESIYPAYSYGNAITLVRAHNDFLQTVAELGLVGGVLIAAVLGMLIWRGISLMFVARQGDLLSVSMLVFLGGVAVNAVFSFPCSL